ncbi:hypothetical protein AOLI_G00013870 [Acnodon oligacanthus]
MEQRCQSSGLKAQVRTVGLSLIELNTVLVEEREREIRQIVQSISDLNEIFRDLAGMVVEQGTVLDRIDFNVEQALRQDRGRTEAAAEG